MSSAYVRFSYIKSIRSEYSSNLRTTELWNVGSYITSELLAISHVSLQVKNLGKSLDFYINGLGMKRIEESADKKRVVLGYSNLPSTALLELIGIEDTKIIQNFKIGDSFIGIGLCTNDIESLANNALKWGGDIIMPIGDYGYAASLIPDEDEMKTTPVIYGKLTDPDGYIIELKKESSSSSLLSPINIQKFILNVVDLDECIEWYSKNLGMNLLRKRSNVMSTPREASFCSYMGYGEETSSPYLELFYKYATDKVEVGDGFSHVAFQTGKPIADMAASLDKDTSAKLFTSEIGEEVLELVDPSLHKIILKHSPA